MNDKDTNISNDSQQPAPLTLTAADIENLADFFDTLIEMDFQAKLRNEQRTFDGTEKTDST